MATGSLLSVDDFERMIAEGAFVGEKEKRVELVEGEIREMSPIGPEHDFVVGILIEHFVRGLPNGSAKFSAPSTVVVGSKSSLLQPDFAIFKPGDSRHRRLRGDEFLLVVEVADSSRSYDLGEKAKLYASAGIAEYWVVDLPQPRLWVHRDPTDDGYRSVEIYGIDQSISPLGFPELKFPVSALFET